jgi:murein DD-endopeptidase MepM/ murein hydrolase activator NlpD
MGEGRAGSPLPAVAQWLRRQHRTPLTRRAAECPPYHRRLVHYFLSATGILGLFSGANAQPFHLPTANLALFEPGGEERFFVPTTGKTWESGCFGCVRTDRMQMHEGLDIKCLQRDPRGEPADPVMATAAGTVVYMNDRPALSNYGRYLVLRHLIGGVEVYSLYAHLSAIRGDLKTGQPVQMGEPIAVMGRTSNTSETITKERAHVHFELNLFYSEHFPAWYKAHFPGEKNDHGIWNGENLVGFDPRLIFLAERDEGAAFNLAAWLQHRPELCRVLARKTSFPWVKRYPMLVKPNPLAQKQGIAGYEIALDYNGLPFEWVPRAASEIKGTAKYRLLSVNEPEETRNPCRKLVKRDGKTWQFAPAALSLLDLLSE